MPSLIKLQDALIQIKSSIENAIKISGTDGKNNLIRSQKPIKLLHDVVKSELIRNKIDHKLIVPGLDKNKGEMKLAGFFKKKSQDICVIPEGEIAQKEKLDSEGILNDQEDRYGRDYTERTLSINVRSQLSSSAKNFDTLYERTFAEAFNLHMRCPKIVLGELYMIAVREYDSTAVKRNRVEFKGNKGVKKHIEKYLLSFEAVNNRKKIDRDEYKYERVCLLIVDFSSKTPKVYNSDSELVKDNLLPNDTKATIKNLNFETFIPDLLKIYSTRFS